MSNELKPCPFCGNLADLRKWPHTIGPDSYQVKCRVCEACLYPKSTESAAVEAWNERFNTFDYVQLLKSAEVFLQGCYSFNKFTKGTPLVNDIPVWMVEFCRDQFNTSPPLPQSLPSPRRRFGRRRM